MSFRHDAIIAVGGFPKIRFGGEETRICEALRDRFGDKCLLADPSVVVAHEYHPDLRGTFKRALRAGFAHGRDYVWRGGIPTIPPNPLLVICAAIGGLLFSPAAAVVLGTGTFTVLFAHVVRARSSESLLYPFLLCIEDSLKGVGFLLGAWRHRSEWRKEVAA